VCRERDRAVEQQIHPLFLQFRDEAKEKAYRANKASFPGASTMAYPVAAFVISVAHLTIMPWQVIEKNKNHVSLITITHLLIIFCRNIWYILAFFIAIKFLTFSSLLAMVESFPTVSNQLIKLNFIFLTSIYMFADISRDYSYLQCFCRCHLQSKVVYRPLGHIASIWFDCCQFGEFAIYNIRIHRFVHICRLF